MYLDDFVNQNLHIINGEVVPHENLLSFLEANIDNKRRFEHSLSVAKLCFEVAKINKLDNPLKYYLAGLLHDVGKTMDKNESRAIVDKYYHQYVNLPEFSYHQFVGEYIVMYKLSIFDDELLKSIRFHCTGNTSMSLMEKVVYACDKIDPLRGYDSSELINAMKKDVNEGFITVLDANFEFLKSKSLTKEAMSLSIFNELSKKCFKQYLNIEERNY